MTLKQVGGRTQRDVQWYLIAIISGGVDADIVIVVHALMEFRYLSQAPATTPHTRDRIQAALNEFHDHKQAVVDLGLRQDQKMEMDHFHIPKLELMQQVVPSIMQVGSLLQWSTDTTEHAHIEVIKDLASMTNNQDYDSQICCTLDRDEKCQLFETAICLREFQEAPQSWDEAELEDDEVESKDNNDIDADNDNDENVLKDLWSAKRQMTDFFKVTAKNANAPTSINSFPPHTLIAASTAIHLNIKPKFRHKSIEEVADMFKLPDLCAALGDYVKAAHTQSLLHTFSHARQSSSDVDLPFTELQVWFKVHLQQKSYYYPEETFPQTFTVSAQPPDQNWKYGHYDTVILQVAKSHQWPMSGVQGV